MHGNRKEDGSPHQSYLHFHLTEGEGGRQDGAVVGKQSEVTITGIDVTALGLMQLNVVVGKQSVVIVKVVGTKPMVVVIVDTTSSEASHASTCHWSVGKYK